MQSFSSVDFAKAVRAIGVELRRHGLRAPGYRSPPRVVGAQRTLRRLPSGSVVAVQIKGRPWAAVLGDMIEGAIVANGLVPPQAARVRTALWAAVGAQAGEAADAAVGVDMVPVGAPAAAGSGAVSVGALARVA